VFAPEDASMLVPSLYVALQRALHNQLFGDGIARSAGRARTPAHHLLTHVSVHRKIGHARN